MKRTKKILASIIVIAMVFSFNICAMADFSAEKNQIELMAGQAELFQQDESDAKWYYMVTDLDHNGRLEIIAASNNGKAEVNVWEINSTYDGLTKCGAMFSEGENFPNVLAENADTYKNASGNIWSYVFTDTNDATDSFNNKLCSLSLLSGNFVYQLHASESSEIINGYLTVTFKDKAGNVITPDEYNNAVRADFEGYERSNTSFGWFRFNEFSESVLADSLAIFKGEKAPAEESVIRENDIMPVTAQDVIATVEPPKVEQELVAERPAQPENPKTEFTPEGYEIVNYSGPETVQYEGNAEEKTTQNEIVYYEQPTQPQIVYPTPAPTPAYVALSVTRNPTNEFRKVGDTARFVACATTVQNLTWSFVDPSGNTVSQQYFCSLFPFSAVDGSSTTLNISNVTAEMNGWGAYCTFTTKDGQIASTNTAYIVMK